MNEQRSQGTTSPIYLKIKQKNISVHDLDDVVFVVGFADVLVLVVVVVLDVGIVGFGNHTPMTAVRIGKYTTSSPLPDPIIPTQKPMMNTDTTNWNTNISIDLA
jgi:hypothetical protein